MAAGQGAANVWPWLGRRGSVAGCGQNVGEDEAYWCCEELFWATG